MRSVIRVGATAGVVGCLSMYPLARGAGLVAALGLIALGIAAGLAMAKWLEWSWYGRQLEAGLKVGLAACIPAGLVALGALLAQGPRDTRELAAASHLGPLSAAGLASAFGFGGWVSADILGVALGTALGVTFAATGGLLAAWSKSARAVQRVTQAHEAALTLRRGTWGPAPTSQMPTFPSSLAAGAAWQGVTSPSVPAPANVIPWAGATQLPAAAPSPAPAAPFPSYAPQTPITAAPAKLDPTLPQLGQPPANTPTNDDELRAAMREALAMWGDDPDEAAPVPADALLPGRDDAGEVEIVEQPTERRQRSGKASQFLNDSKRKGRKKTDTRDWLC